MNKRMNQLHVEAARYAKEKYPNDIVAWSICMSEKFAELIVREQLGIWERMDNGNKVEGYIEMEDYPKAVIKHFGIAK